VLPKPSSLCAFVYALFDVFCYFFCVVGAVWPLDTAASADPAAHLLLYHWGFVLEACWHRSIVSAD
jgi:hypothetical protein